MKYLKKLGLGGRVLVALVVAGAAFGLATAVYADIPDGQTVFACYGKPGTPQKGQLRVRDADTGEQCRFYENNVALSAAFAEGFGDVYQGDGEVTNISAGTTIASVDVPAGSYHIVGTGWAAGLTAGLKDIRCYINQPNGDDLDTFLSVGLDTVDIGGQESFAVQGNIVTAGQTLSLGCLDSGGDGTILEGGQITATAVNNVFGTTIVKPTKAKTFKATPH